MADGKRVRHKPTTVDEMLVAGMLEQACPVCGRWEAAHRYCSKCLRKMGPDDWYRNGDLARRHAVLQKAAENHQTPGKRGRGRPSKKAVVPPESVAVTPGPAAGPWEATLGLD